MRPKATRSPPDTSGSGRPPRLKPTARRKPSDLDLVASTERPQMLRQPRRLLLEGIERPPVLRVGQGGKGAGRIIVYERREPLHLISVASKNLVLGVERLPVQIQECLLTEGP